MALSRHGNRCVSSHSEMMPTGHLSQSGVISVFGATSSPRRTHDCHLSSFASLTPPPRCRTGPTINLAVISTFSGKALSRYRRRRKFSDGDIAPCRIFNVFRRLPLLTSFLLAKLVHDRMKTCHVYFPFQPASHTGPADDRGHVSSSR